MEIETDAEFQKCMKILKLNLEMDDVQMTLDYIEKHWNE